MQALLKMNFVSFIHSDSCSSDGYMVAPTLIHSRRFLLDHNNLEELYSEIDNNHIIKNLPLAHTLSVLAASDPHGNNGVKFDG